MLDYVKRFRYYIPTWIICIFLFFWIFGWTFVIAIVLIIIQWIQMKKIKESYFRVLEEYRVQISEKGNYIETEELKKELEKCQNRIKIADDKIMELKTEIELQKKQYECKLKLKEKALENLMSDNIRIYDRESEKYSMVDSLQKKLNTANKEKLELEEIISQLEEENKILQENIKDGNIELKWERLMLVGKEK